MSDQGDSRPKARRESILRHRQVPAQEDNPPIEHKNRRRVSFRNVKEVQFFDTDKSCPDLLHNSSPKKEKINETLGSDGVMTPGRGTSSDNSNHSSKNNTIEIFGEAAKKPAVYVPPEESAKLIIVDEQNDTLEIFRSPAPIRKKSLIISPIVEDNTSSNRTSHDSTDMSLEIEGFQENDTMQMFDNSVAPEKSVHTMDMFASVRSTPRTVHSKTIDMFATIHSTPRTNQSKTVDIFTPVHSTPRAAHAKTMEMFSPIPLSPIPGTTNYTMNVSKCPSVFEDKRDFFVEEVHLSSRRSYLKDPSFEMSTPIPFSLDVCTGRDQSSPSLEQDRPNSMMENRKEEAKRIELLKLLVQLETHIDSLGIELKQLAGSLPNDVEMAETRNIELLREQVEAVDKQVQKKLEALKKELEFSKQKRIEQAELASLLKAANKEKKYNEILILRKMGGRTNFDDTRDSIVPDYSMINDSCAMETC